MSTTDASHIIATLDDGLILRRATPADAEALTLFQANIHRESEESGPDPYIGAWMADLLSGHHPAVSPADFTVITTAAGEIVSSLCLISQTWSFGGIPVGVGRVELVSTRDDYRRWGLVRTQMDLVHEWSAGRGELIQAITGIPSFYRQFGYEMALDLGAGRVGDRFSIPARTGEGPDPFRLRPATADDIPFLIARDQQGHDRWLLTALRDEALWRYELERDRDPRYKLAVLVITDAEDQPVGSLAHVGSNYDGRLTVVACELVPGISWLAMMPSLLRALRERGDELGATIGAGDLQDLAFNLGGDHPLYHVLPDRLARQQRPYAWYLRVPDLPALLRAIAPVLERRIAASVAPGHSGELLLNSYTSGIRLELVNGRLEKIERWDPPDSQSGSAAFPGLTLLQLVVGYRTLPELEYAFPDCRVNSDEARVLLQILFPKLPSRVWPIE